VSDTAAWGRGRGAAARRRRCQTRRKGEGAARRHGDGGVRHGGGTRARRGGTETAVSDTAAWGRGRGAAVSDTRNGRGLGGGGIPAFGGYGDRGAHHKGVCVPSSV
jgi:hypothetical protein